MKHDYELMHLPSIEPSSYVLVTSHSGSVAVRLYSSARDVPVRRDGARLPSLSELRSLARSAGHPIFEEEGHRVTDSRYWYRKIQAANRKYLPDNLGGFDEIPQVDAANAATTPSSRANGSPIEDGGFTGATGQPLRTLADWQALHPALHWKAGRSAMELARSWSEATGIPATVAESLARGPFGDLRLSRGIAECKTDVPGRGRPSQTDLMVEALAPDGRRIVLGVEGKVDESFGPIVESWLADTDSDRSARNKLERLRGLCAGLGLDESGDAVRALRYQLLHRTYAALVHAKQWNADIAVLLVHSFAAGPDTTNREAFAAFLSELGVIDTPPTGTPVRVGARMGTDLWAVWVADRVGMDRPLKPSPPSLGASTSTTEVKGDPLSIHTGVDDRIDEILGVSDIGRSPHYKRKKSALRLSASPPLDFDGVRLVQELYDLIEGNGESAKGRSPSEENWRFKEKPDISPDNKSLEKTLEKAIARLCGDDWVNQVPTAAGLVGSGERQRNLDLVHRLSETQYDLIELKVGSDTPLYAAMEILKNGLVFLYSRRRRDALGYTKSKNPILWAEHATLVVLAPYAFYARDQRGRYDFGWLRDGIRAGLSSLVDVDRDARLHLDFRFERFPKEFDWCPGGDPMSGISGRVQL